MSDFWSNFTSGPASLMGYKSSDSGGASSAPSSPSPSSSSSPTISSIVSDSVDAITGYKPSEEERSASSTTFWEGLSRLWK
jgi:hypothetical protein